MTIYGSNEILMVQIIQPDFAELKPTISSTCGLLFCTGGQAGTLPSSLIDKSVKLLNLKLQKDVNFVTLTGHNSSPENFGKISMVSFESE